ncbi:MAG: hypothetical protein KGI64_11455 [Xanthomonadaceae bacterium]|nr:hypothetical protein [Xanthomonadaceae bacterium]MDE1885022.1 hypothetical protein [Xanthomonadaceae bacterium]MDE1960409.1 hypothetical protein [Xanthomonadaceae bacterium]MDE2085465.1 hypothetical protein [Xanthomonadaceae bacterium]MDE2257578.1 hypothetical protein [Xanthomonadaceae bacterium]
MKASAIKSLALATAVAGLFAVTTASAANASAGDHAQVKCMHSTSCKGTGACKTKANSCKGHNACKGQGFTMQKDQAACKAAQEAAKAK